MDNLDDMDPQELWSFWKAAQTRAKARELFPDRPLGYCRTTRLLGNYACNKAVAIKLRREGNIARAQAYESICERLYSDLPAYARW